MVFGVGVEIRKHEIRKKEKKKEKTQEIGGEGGKGQKAERKKCYFRESTRLV